MSGGLRGRLEAWRSLQVELGERHQTLSYVRAGFEESTPGPLPRTATATAGDLHRALDALGFDRPFIFVGYSSGAFDALHYADAFPHEVAGLVLVDPTIPMLLRKLARIQKQDRPPRLAPDTPASNEESEEDALEWASSDRIRAIRHRGLGDLPLSVISSEHIANSLDGSAAPAHRDAVTQLWFAEHRRYAAFSSQGTWRIAYGAGHDVPEEAPEAIISAVAWIASRARPYGRAL